MILRGAVSYTHLDVYKRQYMHDMGNSLGGMESYVKLAKEYPQYQGGFIWDYMDQAIWHTDVMRCV